MLESSVGSSRAASRETFRVSRITAVVWFLLVALAVGCTGTPLATSGLTTPAMTDGPNQVPTPIAPTAPSVTASAAFSPWPTPAAVRSALPSRPPVDPRVLIDRFITEFASADPTLHVVIEMGVSQTLVGKTDAWAGVTLQGISSGADFSGSMRSDEVSEFNKDVVSVGDETYVRPLGGAWAQTPNSGTAQPINPMAGLTADDILYRGVRPGTALTILESTRLTGVRLNAIPLDGATSDLARFEIDVTDDGVPVSARLAFLVSGVYRGDQALISHDVDHEFTRVGEPVLIEAPI